eukprot:g33099.t1
MLGYVVITATLRSWFPFGLVFSRFFVFAVSAVELAANLRPSSFVGSAAWPGFDRTRPDRLWAVSGVAVGWGRGGHAADGPARFPIGRAGPGGPGRPVGRDGNHCGATPHLKYEGGGNFGLRGCLNLLNAGKRFGCAERIETVMYFHCHHSLAKGKTRIQLSWHIDDACTTCGQCYSRDVTRLLHLAGKEFYVRSRAEIDCVLKQMVSVQMLNLLGDA